MVWGAVYIMNWVVAKIESMPFSIIKGLYVSELEFTLLLAALLLLFLMVSMRKQRLLIPMLTALLLVTASVTIRLYSSENQSAVTVYSLRRHTAVDFVRGGEHLLLADSTLMADESTVDYSLRGAWAQRHLTSHPLVIGVEEDFENEYLIKKSNLLTFGGKLFALWDDDCQTQDSLSYRLPVDYMLVVDRQRPDVQSVVNAFETKMLLVDASVPRYLAEKWMSQAEELSVPCYYVGDGAFEVGF